MSRSEIIADLRGRIDALAPASSSTRVAKEEPDGSASALPASDESQAAFKKILAWVNASDKPEAAVRERLAAAGFSEQAVDSSVERAKDYGFIDDLRYADVLVRSRISQGKGAAGIERELAAIGVEASDLPGWPHEYGIDDDAEPERALEFLRRKPPRSKNAREAAYRKLVGKGYSSSAASSAARIWAQERSEA